MTSNHPTTIRRRSEGEAFALADLDRPLCRTEVQLARVKAFLDAAERSNEGVQPYSDWT